MREELRRLVEGTELWDGRVCVLQVTDATGGTVQLRALVSAADAGSLWDLRCLVREHLVAWVRDHRPTAMPRMRTELGDANGNLPWQWVQPRRPARRLSDAEAPDDARVFGGSDDGDARSEAFVGPDRNARACPHRPARPRPRGARRATPGRRLHLRPPRRAAQSQVSRLVCPRQLHDHRRVGAGEARETGGGAGAGAGVWSGLGGGCAAGRLWRDRGGWSRIGGAASGQRGR